MEPWRSHGIRVIKEMVANLAKFPIDEIAGWVLSDICEKYGKCVSDIKEKEIEEFCACCEQELAGSDDFRGYEVYYNEDNNTLIVDFLDGSDKVCVKRVCENILS